MVETEDQVLPFICTSFLTMIREGNPQQLSFEMKGFSSIGSHEAIIHQPMTVIETVA